MRMYRTYKHDGILLCALKHNRKQHRSAVTVAAFSKKNPLPVLVWGNGACTNSPWEHYLFLNEIASNGFFVVAIGVFPQEGQRNYGAMSKSEQQIEGIDWAIQQNSDKNSPYYMNEKAEVDLNKAEVTL